MRDTVELVIDGIQYIDFSNTIKLQEGLFSK